MDLGNVLKVKMNLFVVVTTALVYFDVWEQKTKFVCILAHYVIELKIVQLEKMNSCAQLMKNVLRIVNVYFMPWNVQTLVFCY